MPEVSDQGVIIHPETIEAMRKQAGDNVKIQVGLGGIVAGMTEAGDTEGLERINALYGAEILKKAVKAYRQLAI